MAGTMALTQRDGLIPQVRKCCDDFAAEHPILSWNDFASFNLLFPVADVDTDHQGELTIFLIGDANVYVRSIISPNVTTRLGITPLPQNAPDARYLPPPALAV